MSTPATAAARLVVAGIGNEMRGDDGAGPAAVERALLQGVASAEGRAVAVVGPLVGPLDLLDQWEGAEIAVVVDAMRSGSPVGTVTLTYLDAADPEGRAANGDATSPPTHRASEGGLSRPGTHGLSFGDVYRIALQTGSAPTRVALICIEGRDFSLGAGMSAEVDAAASRVADIIVGLIRAHLQARGPLESHLVPVPP
ncbi:MAG TPA: hydrogenase maturation protease [Acidimicrobiales bacterium]|nr:hydrogenase maturation protease [Acidimicrobiales bacterium]